MKPSAFAKKRIEELWDAYDKSGGTQVDFSKKSGFRQGHISQLLRGSRPNADTLFGFAKGFGVPISTFFPPEVSAADVCPSPPKEQVFYQPPSPGEERRPRVQAIINFLEATASEDEMTPFEYARKAVEAERRDKPRAPASKSKPS